MKTITLDEAYAKASKRPIRARFSPEPHILTKGRGSSVAWCINQQDLRGECDAALLAHAFNVLPEVVEALRTLIAPYDGNIDRAPTSVKLARAALAKAKKVVLP